MKKTLLISLLVGAAVLFASQIMAATPSCGCNNKGKGTCGQNGSGCQMAQKVVEAKDFATWQTLAKDCQCANCNAKQIINQSNFSKFQEMHKLMLAGKTAEAQKIRSELGLNGNCMNGSSISLNGKSGCQGKCGNASCGCKSGQTCSGSCAGGACSKNGNTTNTAKPSCGCQNKK